MHALRALVGLPPDPDGAMLFRYLYLLNEPLSFHTDGQVLPPTTFRCRRVVFDQSGGEQRPDWLTDLPAGPTLYATAGTAVNRTPGLVESFLAALRDEPVTLILTIGRDRGPAEFGPGPQPGRVHIERYLPQSLVLSACDLVLSHCGSGTMYAALDHGLSMVNVPVGMDQLENAARCASLKLGLTVDASARMDGAIRDAVREVLADPGYRTNAQRVQQEMQALPAPSDVVAIFERLAGDKQPFAGSDHPVAS
jgi:UDP:flavonoid glycosyltransferase YjiC (YdhE family)